MIKLTKMVRVLREKGKVEEEMEKTVARFLEENRHVAVKAVESLVRIKGLEFGERAKLTKNATRKRFFEVMVQKESNLCLATDVGTAKELLDLAKEGMEILEFKVSVFIFSSPIFLGKFSFCHLSIPFFFETHKDAHIANDLLLYVNQLLFLGYIC
ncbi:hypothetical protein ACB092_04G108600 [Castanea dentata]